MLLLLLHTAVHVLEAVLPVVSVRAFFWLCAVLAECRYRLGPQPAELGGLRALDFVLDNQTLSPTNRTLLLDIKLLAVRSRQ